MSKRNSRWRTSTKEHGARTVARYSPDRVVESSHWVKEPSGGRRRAVKAVTEILFAVMSHEAYGWRNGAKVRKV
jgi:hypothetical protein